MEKIRKIIFVCLLVSILMPKYSSAGTTIVGNGDDGTDLEDVTPIKSGPILEARGRALKMLEDLNVAGISGMGLLIPELERAELLMTSKDSHPTNEQDGSFEISDDRRIVYARTFAQPHAATRFFPSAQKLNPSQLAALHIHEALHRALPSDIRTNEDIVMHLTLAITSPGANHDRVRQVASLYIKESNPVRSSAQAENKIPLPKESIVLPPGSRTRFGYEFDSYSEEKYAAGGDTRFHGLVYEGSPWGFREVFGMPMEPALKIRLKYPEKTYEFSSKRSSSYIGFTSYEIKGRFMTKEKTFFGPLLRYSLKPIDEAIRFNDDRDVFTVGAFYSSKSETSYFDANLSYSTASEARYNYSYRSYTKAYKPILSLGMRTGVTWNYFNLGINAQIDESEGAQTTYDFDYGYPEGRPETFRILTAGPELSFFTNSFEFNLKGKWIINDTRASLTDLGDPMDHGAGRGGLHSSVKVVF